MDSLPNLKILGGFFEKLSDAKLFVSKASKAILKGKFIFSSHCNVRNYYPASYCCNCSANVYGWEIDRDEIQKQHEHVGLSKNFFNKCRIE